MDNTFVNWTSLYVFILICIECMESPSLSLTKQIEIFSCLVVHIPVFKVDMFTYLQVL